MTLNELWECLTGLFVDLDASETRVRLKDHSNGCLFSNNSLFRVTSKIKYHTKVVVGLDEWNGIKWIWRGLNFISILIICLVYRMVKI